MFQMKNVLFRSANVALRGSIILAFLLLSIQIVSSNKFTTIGHKTKEAAEVKPDLYCFSCDYLSNDEDCVNMNRTRQLNLTKKCEPDQNFCVVKRFSYTTSDKNSTSEKKLWSLQRDCTDRCENGCIVIGERVKLYACSTCCHTSLCNTSSRGGLVVPSALFVAITVLLRS